MKIAERKSNLEKQYQEVLNQLASMTNPNDGINLVIARERIQGAIELCTVLIEEEEPKEDKDAKSKSSKV